MHPHDMIILKEFNMKPTHYQDNAEQNLPSLSSGRSDRLPARITRENGIWNVLLKFFGHVVW